MTDQPSLVWFRDDLRLADNPALRAAMDQDAPLVCLYVLDDEAPGPWSLGGASRWWLHYSLTALGEEIARVGGTFVLRRGDAGTIVREVAGEMGAKNIFWNRRYMAWHVDQDKELKAGLTDEGYDVQSFNGHLLNEPWQIETKTGGPYRVYTPYWKQVQAREIRDPLPGVRKLKGLENAPPSDDLDDWDLLPAEPNWAEGFEPVWTPGERGASERWRDWLKDSGQRYDSERNRPDLDSTSRMAPHLAFGEISVVSMYSAMQEAIAEGDVPEEEGKTFLSELAWREFSYHLIFYNPSMFDEPLMQKFADFEWSDDDAMFRAWTKGQTGYPIVDAGMRQLWTEGHMHNRVRMIVGSFLVKDLLIDWKRGMAWFWDTLVCADPASNTASWQWVAGCGADAAPFFRIFNPMTQGEKFDPDGTYVRRHVPELAKLPAKYIHTPWKAPDDVLKEAGIDLGTTYPEPIVDHAVMRKKALSRYEDIK